MNNSDPSSTDWLIDDPLGFNDLSQESDSETNDLKIHNVDNNMENHLMPEPTEDDSQLNSTNREYENSEMHHLSTKTSEFDGIEPNSFDQNNLEQNNLNRNNLDQNSLDSEIEFDGDTSRANPHFKPLLPEPIHRGESGRQLIMDTETTGLDALKGDRIIEVGIVELVDRKFTGEKLHVYINPQRGMDEEVISVHGISEAFLEDKPTFDKVAQKLYEFMLGAEVIAHNASFDINFLTMEFDKVGLKGFADKIKITDSLAMAKQQYPGQKNTLDALVRRLNVGKMDRTFHGALLDSEILAEVYLAMTGGQVALAIDEDITTEGAGSHANFSHLADQIQKAQDLYADHLSWIAKVVQKHPSVATTQGIHCFKKIDEQSNVNTPVVSESSILDSNFDSSLFRFNKDVFMSS